QKIVTTLKLQLMLEEQGYSVRKHTANLDAYDCYLRGRASFNRRLTPEANAQARQLFEQALVLDPHYADACVSLGNTYYAEWMWRWSADPQTLERAGELAQKALTLDDSVPFAHALLGMVYGNKQQYDQAITAGERALALDPNNAGSYVSQAEVLHFAGRPAEALRALEQAIRLNPRGTPQCLFLLGYTYYIVGRYGEAIATLQEVIRRSPDHAYAHFTLATSYLLQWFCQQSPAAQTLEPAAAAVQRALALNDA